MPLLTRIHTTLPDTASAQALAEALLTAGLEVNPYGDTETRYASLLSKRYLKHQPSIPGTGITIVPKASLAKPEVRSLFSDLG